ncbi:MULTISPECIES: DMT family transporter [Deinococcus]|jgi:Membrane transporters of cations and cationic drugs|uniref:SugE protein n=1 Tax=Deinococcus radiodurans (strain ATCC 13939 / DSM 20539 / JCM 16871 / CCUG 27074 / LMG 4051 / NBRC 15346 / NCIMB 9279 / VKM B-1422 / R1) TaxID=243230 RepID=Q9RVM3_DEIRA|nr:multidrug efflux SMR transporter [Deinococcus radiodurans]AAF10579.1 sugE protein [Deinococcus radiodurans R1 = ATCC 13939 = DSM 20539]ANC71806.1 cation transporter [Deinococcus radiodurans R1 = ATCC 13939 = DSM 20539]QEM70498.1 QacE family quaternary ammonium compound efflux SMR transporter [Deinococcus radiodurans]QIP29105.1 multidrug efflux SMR transporter [Deinococcus radiodurans]QIP32195.1 multidrug efflux SMR transporter [Deinococcus radiodurans]
MNAWTALVLAGLFEVGFTTALKLEQQNKNWGWAFIVCAWISFGFLAQAIETIPLGTAYAVWTGIGAVGTVLVGRVFFGEQLGGRKLALLAVMVAAILGLKVTA